MYSVEDEEIIIDSFDTFRQLHVYGSGVPSSALKLNRAASIRHIVPHETHPTLLLNANNSSRVHKSCLAVFRPLHPRFGVCRRRPSTLSFNFYHLPYYNK